MLSIDFSRLSRLARRIRGCFSLVRSDACSGQKACLILNGRYPVHVVSTEAEYQHCELHRIPVLRAPLPESDEALLAELRVMISMVRGESSADDLPSAEGYALAQELANRLEEGCRGSNC
jgi:hypothetical protein